MEARKGEDDLGDNKVADTCDRECETDLGDIKVAETCDRDVVFGSSSTAGGVFTGSDIPRPLMHSHHPPGHGHPPASSPPHFSAPIPYNETINTIYHHLHGGVHLSQGGQAGGGEGW